VRTTTQQDGMQLVTEADVEARGDAAHCRYVARARSQAPGWLVIALRPVNPEGVAFIHRVQTHGEGQVWTVDDQTRVEFDAAPQRVAMSNYKAGDVAHTLPQAEPATALTCDVGMVTAVAMFELTPGQERQVTARVPLRWPNPPLEARVARHSRPLVERASWSQALEGCCRAQLPDRAMTFLFDAALRTLVLHAPGEVYPGPYTYKRFWFRDAAIILESLLQVGMLERVKRALSGFPTRQTLTGYFRSQDGEWDSNGQVLWIMQRYRELSGEALPASWIEPIRIGARWIERKRTSDALDAAHAGLMPAGFSAEHLGPNDYYYWDDFWSAAGLRSAAAILAEAGQSREADLCRQTMAMLMAAVDRSLRMHNTQRDRLGIPASPYRRMDAGAIGSLAASYPLRLWDPADPRMMQTIEFLLRHCMVHGGFFQDVIHSGINAYLTLHMAQVMLRADDERSFALMEAVAKLASPTGQWPEAIHPRTGGGCMGDGHHVWAAAEWVAMVRNLFVREEGETLVLCSGLPRQWTDDTGAAMSLGPTLTPFGSVSVQARRQGQGLEVAWQASWRRMPGALLIKAPGFEPVEADPQAQRVVLQPAQSLAAT
jgi:hypothetical protein